MALSPDTTESFAREVDENLRRDLARDAAKRYGGMAALAVILFLAAVCGFLYYKDRKAKAAVMRVMIFPEAVWARLQTI